MTTPLPAALARRRNGVLRPRDAREVYAHPAPELRRLALGGALVRLAHGYYLRVPYDRLGDADWRPDLHAAALGVAQCDAGVDDVALMHVSAARLLGGIARELALAVVAVPSSRPALELSVGTVVFVTRDVSRLDVQRVVTTVGEGWVTTAEQTVLDLAQRPTLGGLDPVTALDAATALADLADREELVRLATRQRRLPALRRLELDPDGDGSTGARRA